MPMHQTIQLKNNEKNGIKPKTNTINIIHVIYQYITYYQVLLSIIITN